MVQIKKAWVEAPCRKLSFQIIKNQDQHLLVVTSVNCINCKKKLNHCKSLVLAIKKLIIISSITLLFEFVWNKIIT